MPEISQKKNNFAIIFAFLILGCVFIFRFFWVEDFARGDFWKIFIFYLGAFFLLPWGGIVWFFNLSLKDFFWGGFSLSKLKTKVQYFLLFFVWIGFFWWLMIKFNLWEHFPVSPWIFGRWDLIVFLELSFLPLILFFQEFFYRGFLLKVFSDRLGVWPAIFLQAGTAVTFEALFIGRVYWLMGVLGIFYCFLGWISWRNKNFVYSWGWIVGASLFFDLVVKYQINQFVK